MCQCICENVESWCIRQGDPLTANWNIDSESRCSCKDRISLAPESGYFLHDSSFTLYTRVLHLLATKYTKRTNLPTKKQRMKCIKKINPFWLQIRILYIIIWFRIYTNGLCIYIVLCHVLNRIHANVGGMCFREWYILFYTHTHT